MIATPTCLAALIDEDAGSQRSIRMGDRTVRFADCLGKTALGGEVERLEGRSVILLSGDQLSAAAALIELDGWVRRIILCPPDFELRHLRAVIRDGEADALVYDAKRGPPDDAKSLQLAPCGLPLQRSTAVLTRRFASEWALFTSGTTGDPKMVVHTLATLTAAIPVQAGKAVGHWATFYDIRRFGGLQIFLRAAAGCDSLELREEGEDLADFFHRLRRMRVTHISGTPSHWRLALINSAAAEAEFEYVRLSGEVADASLLSALSRLYPRARIAHAYASTEAGVGFEVDDHRAGFPAVFLGEDRETAMRLINGSLAMRSERTALRYLGRAAPPLRDREGFVDTGDLIEVRGDRCFFLGRRGGIINVGGSKVNPEEVEAVICRHASVHDCLVKARTNPITGALVQADVVLKPGVLQTATIRDEILAECAAQLAYYKVPALLRFVPSLTVSAGGKLARQN
jgi:acyl-coenzyme A synthetase/AMP-(fatty) acid ligase